MSSQLWLSSHHFASELSLTLQVSRIAGALDHDRKCIQKFLRHDLRWDELSQLRRLNVVPTLGDVHEWD
jgi:hypothetical protein